LPIDVDDLRTLTNLAKDVLNVTFIIDDGTTTCKIGKINKQFTQPRADDPPVKDPRFETTVSVTFNDSQSAELVATFSDLKEMGDLKVNANEEGIKFGVSESNRYTNIEFAPGDLTAYTSTQAATAGYDLDMAVSLFKSKQKGSILVFEFGRDMPMKVVQTTTQGTISTILAPKIYD
jgi:light-regulated signal transduction histidine kinase (bacteriophytochrome)